MPHNSGGEFGIDRGVGSMDKFDNLPAAIREILRTAPYDIAESRVMDAIQYLGAADTILWLTTGIPAVIKESTILTYGPDHPQAK